MDHKYKQSRAEKLLLKELIDLKLDPKPQYEIGTMHVDIAFPQKTAIGYFDLKKGKNLKSKPKIHNKKHIDSGRNYFDLRKGKILTFFKIKNQ